MSTHENGTPRTSAEARADTADRRPGTWIRAVADARGLSKQAKSVAFALTAHVRWKTGRAWPSVATLAQETSWSERTVQRAMRELERRGLLRYPDGRTGGFRGRAPVCILDLDGLRALGNRSPAAGHRAERDGCPADGGGVTATTPTGDRRAPKQGLEQEIERGRNHPPQSCGSRWNIPKAFGDHRRENGDNQ